MEGEKESLWKNVPAAEGEEQEIPPFTFNENPFEDDPFGAIDEFNEDEALHQEGISIDVENDKNTKSIVTAAAAVLILKITEKQGPKWFYEATKALERLVEKKKLNLDRDIKILGFQTSYSIRDLIGKWKDIGKFMWPKADWDSVKELNLDTGSIEKINTVIGQLGGLVLEKDQIDSLSSKISGELVKELQKNPNAIDTVSFDQYDIEEVNEEIVDISKLNLPEAEISKKKAEVAELKLKELLARKLQKSLL